jgi:hypothetical protein
LESGHEAGRNYLSADPQGFNVLTLVDDYALLSAKAGLPLLASPKHRRALLTLKDIATKIMKSGIFYEGGLDAKTRHDPYPIQDLDQFIHDLALFLWEYERRMTRYDHEAINEGLLTKEGKLTQSGFAYVSKN